MSERGSNEFEFPSHGLETIPLEKVDLYSERAAQLVETGTPFVTHISDWKALEWTPESLKERVGDRTVSVLRYDHEHEDISVSEFLDLVAEPERYRKKYVLHNFPLIRLCGRDGFNPDFETLLDDVSLPDFIPRQSIGEMFVWARNTGYYNNGSHAEPNALANLNLQVRGKKHVWLFPPDDAGLVDAEPSILLPPYFAAGQRAYHVDDHPGFADAHCYETVLQAGDAIYIPPFWYHWFVHYDEYQLNLNIWFQTERRVLSRLSAAWAYGTALALALGGAVEDATEKFEQLSPETQDVLRRVERVLLDDPAVLKPLALRFTVKPSSDLDVDPSLFGEPEDP